MSRDKIDHDSWSISAALARGFTDRHFERGEGPGDEVDAKIMAVLGSQGIVMKCTAAIFFRTVDCVESNSFLLWFCFSTLCDW